MRIKTSFLAVLALGSLAGCKSDNKAQLFPVNEAPTISGSPSATVLMGANYSFTPTAHDDDGDTLSFSVLNKPDWATFSTTTGALNGTPASLSTSSGIVITVSDGKDSSSLAAFSLQVTNGNFAPTISGTPPTTIATGKPYSFTPMAADADGDALTFSITNAPSWASFNTATGALTGTPSAIGMFSNIVITVSDGQASSSLPAFTVQAVTTNSAPTITGTPATMATVGVAYSFTPGASDPDGDALGFSITGKPSWATFSATTGALTGTPSAAGTFSNIIISVNDGQVSTALPSFAVQVSAANQAPTISGTPPTTGTVGVAYSFTPIASDQEGDALTFSITGKPSWATFSTTTGKLSGTPSAAGTFSNIIIKVADASHAAVSLVTFSIQVQAANQAPTISGTPATTGTVGVAYSFTPTASDPESDTLTYSITGKPSWATFSTTTGALTGTPSAAGTFSNIVIKVADASHAAVSLATFSIQVQAANQAPTISGTPATTGTVGVAYSFTPTASDPESDTLTFSITGMPSWASFSTTTGALTGTPSAAGTFSNIVIKVADPSHVAVSLATFSIQVQAPILIPTIGGTPSTTATVGFAYSFTPIATGTGVIFSIVNKPSWASFSTTTGTLSGTPATGDIGTQAGIIITVSIGPLNAALATFAITVQAANPLPTTIFPADRVTTWHPGVPGGVPARSTVCATVNASTYNNGATDAATGIQTAIDNCPAGQVVQLSAGTFLINSGHFLMIDKGITLRGAGADQTTLQKTNGAKPGVEAVGSNASPIVILGPAQYALNGGIGTSANLSADAAKGAFTATVASGSGFAAGQIVLLDELSGAGWQIDPTGRGQIWASPDFRVVWQLHKPGQQTDDPLILPANAGNQDAFGWFSRLDRPTAEIKEVASVAGNVVTFTTPIHISYRTSHTAQLTRYNLTHTANAGIENLKVIGGDNGNIRFHWCNACWAKSVENTVWHDEGFAIDNSFRVEIREAYIHDAAWAQPGGAGYAISLANGSSEVLIENSISIRANKVMVARSAGAGSVFGYNYVDDGYINSNGAWIEVGLNASHMVGPHHVLFEGNHGFNFDSDKTHGNAIYHTVFRNYLTGVRRSFNNQSGGGLIDDANQPGNGPRRTAGAAAYSYWHSFIGNVLGVPGKMNGWVYQDTNNNDVLMDHPAIWLLGWDDWSPYTTDINVAISTLRHGNFDYVTNSVTWDPLIADHNIPDSLYLAQKPAFFNAGKGYTWPWVDPIGSTKVFELPAKARYDAGTPFVQP